MASSPKMSFVLNGTGALKVIMALVIRVHASRLRTNKAQNHEARKAVGTEVLAFSLSH